MKTRCPHCGQEIEFDDATILALARAEAPRVLGAKGGRATTEKKRLSNAVNAKKGGWPKGKPRKTKTE